MYFYFRTEPSVLRYCMKRRESQLTKQKSFIFESLEAHATEGNVVHLFEVLC